MQTDPMHGPLRTPGDEGHLLDHFAFLGRRWRTILAVFAGFVAVGAFSTWRMPPVYEATTRILVGSGGSGSLLSERSSPIESYFLERRSFETQLEIIRSEPVAERAALRLGRIDAEAPEDARRAAAVAIKGSVFVERVRDTRIVLLRARAGSAEAARDLTDAVAQSYIAYSEEQRNEARVRSIAWLTDETAKLREALRASEERLVDYLSREQIDPEVDEGDPAAAAGGDPLRTQIAAAALELAKLEQRYRERHPRVLEARTRLEDLQQRAAVDQGRRAEEHRKLIQYRILKRDADLDHEMYQVLLKKLKEADLSTGIAEGDIRVLEAAKLPRAPIAPHTLRNLAVAAVLGLCLALGVAYGAEALDRTLTSPDQIQRALGLPTLGVVRRYEPRADALLAAETSGSPESESFRSLRTNVRYSHVDKPRRVVVITSTGPEEGKSTVLANLAVSLAQSGRRTLVIDTDLRRPSLHRIFRRPNRRGLADLLAGDTTLEETIQSTHVADLDVLLSGTLPPNPAELIESARLHDRIQELRDVYDFVLLDSPPTGGLIDSSLLCALADGVLFVVEPGRFDARLLRSAVRQLERAGARLYGVVLNKAPRDDRGAIYGYGYRERAEAGARESAPAEGTG